MCPPHGCLLRSDERAVRADLPDLLCMCTFSGFVFSPFFLFSALTGFSCSCGRSGSPRPHGDSWGRRSCREKHVVQCRARLRVGRGGERDRGREGHQDRDWVCSELFLWLQPKIRQGRVQEQMQRDRGWVSMVVARSRVAGGWQGDGEPEMGRSGCVSCAGGRCRAREGGQKWSEGAGARDGGDVEG